MLEIEVELTRAKTKFPEFYNAHEGYAVLLEEVDELWDAVKLNGTKHPERIREIHKEATQVAAMALELMCHTSNLERWE